MIKVLGLSLYGPLAASTRYRLGQYIPGLAKLGIELHVCHLLGDEYLRSRFDHRPLPIAAMLRMGFDRFADLWHQNDYDLVLLHCELFPLLPGWLERVLIRRPYIYDFDDAFYLKYRCRKMAFARHLLGDKFNTVIAGAAAVTAGSHELSRYARQYNANTYFLPTVVDMDRYLPCLADRNTPTFTIGWIGSPSTATYLSELVAPLSILGQEGPVRLVIIGGKAPAIPNVDVVEVGWQEHTEIDWINQFDVGVMPMPDDDWARGKCAFKLIQYMACAVPVVASRVGANIDVVTAEAGYLAQNEADWLEAFRLLRDQPKIRQHKGEAGRLRVEQSYSLHRNLPVLADVIFKAK